MSTRPLRDMLPLVLPHVPGCPYMEVIKNLRLAAIEWCERTRCWRSITTVAITGQGQAVVAPHYATIHEIETAHMAGQRLTPTQFSHIDQQDRGEDNVSGPPRYITQVSPNEITLVPFSTGDLELSLFLKPRSGDEVGSNGQGGWLQDDQNVIPQHIFVQDAEAISWGALSRLMAQPKKEWTNPNMAVYYENKFGARADSKFSSNVEGQQKARPRSRPQWI